MNRNEIKLGETIIKRNSDLKCEYVVADKIYDSQNYHDLAKQNLGATAIIPVRNLTDKLHRTKGKDRKKKYLRSYLLNDKKKLHIQINIKKG